MYSPDEVWWRARRDSNPQPSVPKTDALPIELRAHAARGLHLRQRQADEEILGHTCRACNLNPTFLSDDSRVL